MTKIEEITATQAIKLASLAVHAEEYLATFRVDPPAALFDEQALVGGLTDPDVRAVLDDPANRVFLPEKRSAALEGEA